MESKDLSLSVSPPEHRVERYLHHHDAGLYPNSPKPRSLGTSYVLRAAAKRIGGWMMTFQSNDHWKITLGRRFNTEAAMPERAVYSTR